MAKLILFRHLKSQWNQENRFTGWVDVPLLKNAQRKARNLSQKIFKFKIDTIYSSPLFRNQESVALVLKYQKKQYPIFVHLDQGKMKTWGKFKDIGRDDLLVYISEALNERYYGTLQGLNKKKTMEKYGKKKVHLWRRSYDISPPDGESLKDVIKRTLPFYKRYIEKDLKKGKNVLVVASHNALRAVIKHIEKISDRDIINVEVPFAGIIEYDFDKSLRLKSKKSL